MSLTLKHRLNKPTDVTGLCGRVLRGSPVQQLVAQQCLLRTAVTKQLCSAADAASRDLNTLSAFLS